MTFCDNNMSRYVSITILNSGMPPFDMDDGTIAAYVRQLECIPEKELREVIWNGLKVWERLPTIAEILELWRQDFAPVDEMWSEVFVEEKRT